MRKLIIILLAATLCPSCVSLGLPGPKTGSDYTADELDAYPLTEKERQCVERDQIFIGMSDVALALSWGEPSDIHESVGRWGRHQQWVYDRNRRRPQYVYVENGKVTSWQN